VILRNIKGDTLMEQLKKNLLKMGASLVGFAKVDGLYKKCELSTLATQDSEKEYFTISELPFGISIAIKIPKDIVKGISGGPTIDYYNTYYNLNNELDKLALYCEQYLTSKGYKAYAQTVERTKEYGIFQTIMPHKTVAVNAGIGWIGKSALLVTEEFGSAIRLTSVLTNAALTTSDKVKEVPCLNCDVCTNACPAGAISGKVWEKDSDRDHIFDALKCRKTARKIAAAAINKEITLCGKCIEACPYTKRYLNTGNL
jgi:epoxyqueuosine reductase QueG